MDTTKEYIKMCEKAFKDIGFIKQPRRELHNRLKNLYATFADNFLISQFDPPKKGYFQLYFQDQLQEMIRDKKVTHNCESEMSIPGLLNLAVSCYESKNYGFSSFEILWLSVVMSRKYQKTWNGGDWEERSC